MENLKLKNLILLALALLLIVFLQPKNQVTKQTEELKFGTAITTSDYAQCKTITVDNTKVTGTSNLSGFPMLIDLTDSDLAADADSDGGDIVFTDNSGEILLFEVESYSAGRLTVWASSTLDFDDDTTIKMYYATTTNVGSQASTTGPWDLNYIAVYHMNDNAANATVNDSTSNNKDGTSSTNTNNMTINGQMNNALDFDGLSDDINTAITNAFGDFTMELWFKTNTSAGGQRLLDKTYDVGMWMGQATDGTSGKMGGGVREAVDPYGIFVTLANGSWHHIATVRTGTTHKIRGDGGAVNTSNTVSATALSGNTLFIGSTDVGGFFTGQIDEVRISNIARSDDWISTQYNNHSATSTFYTVSAEFDNTCAAASSVSPKFQSKNADVKFKNASVKIKN